ncbi:glycosyltransferase family 2 protein [Agromyces sp. GXS1127]|uniref:glycosyltransferase family 2 protein n=1 Tax=Agromyces sp. GXS1127 TaxID=3424181 RepID=UPI003D31F3DB
MPAHDVEGYVGPALRSILAQGYWRVEVIVIDDASSDRTGAIVARIAARDPRVRLIRVGFGDPNRARNHGIERARGEFLGFLDGDDILRAGALRDLVAALEASGSDFAVGSYDRLIGRRRTPPAFWISEAHAEDRRGVDVESAPEVMVNAVQWTKLYRRDFWNAAGLSFPETGGHFQDQLVSARAYATARRFDVLRREVVSWRVRSDGSSMTQQTVRPRQIADRFSTAAGALELLARRSPEVARQRLVQYLSNDAAIASGDIPRMSADAWAALRDGLGSIAPPFGVHEVWNEVPAEFKVLYHFVLADDRAAAQRYIDQGGFRVLDHALIRVGGVPHIKLPYWADDAAAVPVHLFRAAPRELRAFAARERDQSASNPGSTSPGHRS